MRPLAIDLFTGRGGWTHVLIAAGWRAVGFDIAADLVRGNPAEVVLQDVRTIHGSQFRNAGLIVASPPCTEYSYMAMPWSRAKQIARALRGDGEFPKGYAGSRTVEQLNALFDACFRIQREACEAAGRHIPMVVENVRGARPWVKQPSARFGSFYLFGDVPALIPIARKAQKFNPDGTNHGQGSWFAIANSKNRGGRKVAMNVQSAAVAECGIKQGGSGAAWWDKALDERRKEATRALREQEGTKGGGDWFGSGSDCSLQRRHSSRSNARREASALIAMIPFDLARWIGEVYLPTGRVSCVQEKPFRSVNDLGTKE